MEKLEHEFALALRQAAGGRVTVELSVVWQCFHGIRPQLRAAVGSRGQLAADLRSLAEAGALSLPASKTSFDRSALPPLPRFVRLVTAPVIVEPRFDHQTFPWSLPMSFVASLNRLPNPEQARQLNDFFKQGGGSRPFVPVKERSYGIFRNEKVLERVLAGQLGQPGRLTLDLLRCYRVRLMPVHFTFPGAPADMFIAENEATFDTVVRWNREHQQFRMVVYGRGKEIEKAAPFLLEESQSHTGAIFYFGDLDRHGVLIPYRLSQALVEQGGRPLVPANACYRCLMQEVPSTVTAPETAEDEDVLDDTASLAWREALQWLPAEVRLMAESLLTEDLRIAQEATGWERLSREPSLI